MKTLKQQLKIYKRNYRIAVILMFTFEILFVLAILDKITMVSIAAPIFENFNPLYKADADEEQQIANKCNKTYLRDSVECVIKEVDFMYNLDYSGQRIDYKVLDANGGVCVHAASIYHNIFKKQGKDVKKVAISIGEEGHIFNIVSDEYSYCVVDIDLFWCV